MYISFLKGINVGGHHKVDMKDLKKIYEQAGYSNVMTYLNTGNVIFDSDDNRDLIGKIKSLISEKYDFDISVMVLTEADLVELVASYQFEIDEKKNRYVTLFSNQVNEKLENMILLSKRESDQFQIHETHLNLYVPEGYGKSKLTNSFIEKHSGVSCTTRNMNTMEKLLSIIDKG